MWQAIEILLIATFGSASSDANFAEQDGNPNGSPTARAAELYPAVVVDQRSTVQEAGANWGNQAEGVTLSADSCHDSPGWLAGPCVFDSFWDVTGGRPPTDYIGVWGYGPDCTVARARLEWLL